jgi:hypothetical protein
LAGGRRQKKWRELNPLLNKKVLISNKANKIKLPLYALLASVVTHTHTHTHTHTPHH